MRQSLLYKGFRVDADCLRLRDGTGWSAWYVLYLHLGDKTHVKSVDLKGSLPTTDDAIETAFEAARQDIDQRLDDEAEQKAEAAGGVDSLQ